MSEFNPCGGPRGLIEIPLPRYVRILHPPATLQGLHSVQMLALDAELLEDGAKGAGRNVAGMVRDQRPSGLKRAKFPASSE